VSNLQSPTVALEQALLSRLGETQRQLDELREQLTESQRLATIGTIAAVIAHEFNNLLTPIVSYSQFALQSAKGDAPDMELICKALSKAFASADKAGKICTAMLALARGESSAEKVAVQSLVDETLMVLARDPQKDGIALRVQVPGELWAGYPRTPAGEDFPAVFHDQGNGPERRIARNGTGAGDLQGHHRTPPRQDHG